MKKSILISVYFVLAIVVLSSCNPFHRRIRGHGNSITVSSNINIEDVHKIEANSSIDVEVIYSDNSYVSITAQENIVDIIRLKVKDDILIIDTKHNTSFNATDITKVTVYIPYFSSLIVNGSGDIKTFGEFVYNERELKMIVNGSGDIKTEDAACSTLDITVNGSGDIKSEKISCSEIKTSISGSGEVKLNNIDASIMTTTINGSGDVDYNGKLSHKHSIKIRGSGNINAYGLNTDIVEVRTSGSGDSHVWAIASLNVVINGSGDVFYKGTPQVSVESHGSGKVVSRQ